MIPPLRRYPALGALALAPLFLAPTPVAVEGWSFISTTTSDVRGAPEMSMQVRLAGPQLRVDFLKGTTGMTPGAYMLLNAETSQLTMVSPKEKSATVLPVGGMASMLGAVGAAGIMKIEIDNVSVTVEDLGAGDAILGHGTHRYRVKESHTMNVSVMGMHRSGTTATDTEMWIATDVSRTEQRAFEAFAANFAQSMGGAGFGGDGMRKLTDELQRKMPKGLVLRQIATTRQTDQGGKETTSVTTTEVKEFKQARLDEKLFEVPKDYVVTDLGAAMEEAKAARAKAKADCEKEKGAANCESAGEVNYDSVRKAAAESSKASRDRAMKGAVNDFTGGMAGKLGGMFGKKPPADTTRRSRRGSRRDGDPAVTGAERRALARRCGATPGGCLTSRR